MAPRSLHRVLIVTFVVSLTANVLLSVRQFRDRNAKFAQNPPRPALSPSHLGGPCPPAIGVHAADATAVTKSTNGSDPDHPHPELLSGTPRNRFEKENTDPQWAREEEDALRQHLSALLGPYGIRLDVQCKNTCCKFSAGDRDIDWGLVASEIQTDAGLHGWGHATTFSSDGVVTCSTGIVSSRSEDARVSAGILVRERNQLFDRLRTHFGRCAELTTVRTSVTVSMAVDVTGLVISSTRDGELAGSEAAVCVEKRILESAQFSPQLDPKLVQIRVDLTPARLGAPPE